MKLINRDTDLAVRALVHIAQFKEAPVKATELETILAAPRPFLRKTLQTLQTKGFLKSYKGKFGGFKLNMLAENIYFKDLVEAFHGNMNTNECVFNKTLCPDVRSCLLKEKIAKVKAYVSSELGSITIASLMPKKGAKYERNI
jgi:Rrf2 family protein